MLEVVTLNITYLTQPDGKGGDFAWNWVVPFEQDPVIQNTIYCAFDEVYKSIDGGVNWTSISQNFSSDIDHLKIAPLDNNKMYLSIGGSFWYTTDAGVSWVQSGINLSGGDINGIAVHPTDPNKIAIVIDRNVPKKFKKILEKILNAYNLTFIIFNANEKSKSLKIVNLYINQLLQKKFNRSDLIIGVGGGITNGRVLIAD